MRKRRAVTRPVWTATTMALVCAAVACGDDPVGPGDPCGILNLPLEGQADAPTVTAVALEVQGGGIVLLATATDPQGSPDLLDVDQTIRVFPDDRCQGAPRVFRDDLAGSGVEESFGTVVEADADPELFQAISAATGWPVEVEFRDAGGHVTAGTVEARVQR